jgi:CyaY protein
MISTMLDEQGFRLKADEALSRLHSALVAASDEHEFEADYGGALTIEFDDPPQKFVVSPNAPVRQIWVSAHSTSFKLDWDSSRDEFVLGETGQSLKELIQDAVSKQLGKDIEL